jgi:hypothetical protein
MGTFNNTFGFDRFVKFNRCYMCNLGKLQNIHSKYSTKNQKIIMYRRCMHIDAGENMKKIPLNLVNVPITNNAKSKMRLILKKRPNVEQLHILKMSQVPFVLKSLIIVVSLASIATLAQVGIYIYEYNYRGARGTSIQCGFSTLHIL